MQINLLHNIMKTNATNYYFETKQMLIMSISALLFRKEGTREKPSVPSLQRPFVVAATSASLLFFALLLCVSGYLCT